MALPGAARRADPNVSVAGFIDVETTGLDPAAHEVVELAIALVAFDRETGDILGIVDEYAGLRDPGFPIPADATRVHGLRSTDVRGKRLDDARIRAMLERAEFLVAHNASFDKAFVTKLYPEVQRKRWVCSMRSIPWKQKGFPSRGLQSLVGHCLQE